MKANSRVRLTVVTAVVALVATLAATAGASAAPQTTSAPAATGRTITVGVQQAYNVMPIFTALRHGFLKRSGISGVKFVVFASPAVMMAAVAQGQIDIGFQTVPVVNNYNRATSGTKLKFIAAGTVDANMWMAPLGTSIRAATKSDWQSGVRSWRGKRVATPAPGGILDLITRYMVKKVGMTPGEDVTFSTVLPGPAALAALEQGLVDVVSADPFTLALMQSPKRVGRNVLGFGLDQGPSELLGTIVAAYFTSEDAIAKDRATFAAFADGLAKTRAFMAKPTSKRTVTDLLVKKVGVSAAQAEILWRLGIPIMAAKAKMDRQSFNKTISAFVSTGVLSGSPPSYADLVADFAK